LIVEITESPTTTFERLSGKREANSATQVVVSTDTTRSSASFSPFLTTASRRRALLVKAFDPAFSRVHGLGIERQVVIGVESLTGCRRVSRANTKSGSFASSAFLASVFPFSGSDSSCG
jgi:hypothetical protein